MSESLLLQLLQLLIYLLRHHSPLRAASDLSAALKGPTMGVINLKWTDATKRIDSTPGTVATVDIYEETNPDAPIATVPGGVQTFDVTGFAAGTWNFGIVFVDSTGLRSALSNIASATVPVPTPSPLVAASDLTATYVP